MSDKYTVVLLYSGSTGPVETFLVPTAQISERDKEDIIALAQTQHMAVMFFVVGWQGIEATKWDIERFKERHP